MSGRHPFSELTKDFTPERRRRIDKIKRELLTEMPLHELRRARSLTQRDMAKMLKVNQPDVSKLEQRTDVYVSSLRSYIEAVGGKLKIVGRVSQGRGSNHQLFGRGDRRERRRRTIGTAVRGPTRGVGERRVAV